LFGVSVNNSSIAPLGVKELWDVGLGSVSDSFLLHWGSKLIGNIFIVNILQPLFSILYFIYNGLLTSMLLASEWSGYSVKRRGLRVSSRCRGSQRSTYFLSLPYRYAVPLIAVSGVIHWLLSQSLFLVSIEAYGYSYDSGFYGDPYNNGSIERIRLPSEDFIACGTSPIGFLLIALVIAVLILTIILIGSRRFKTGMPVVGSCSAAIAAACHPDSDEDENAATKPLMWGVTSFRQAGIGHCSFSSKDVCPPTEGQQYAGTTSTLDGDRGL
jgi:hypothetical protein